MLGHCRVKKVLEVKRRHLAAEEQELEEQARLRELAEEEAGVVRLPPTRGGAGGAKPSNDQEDYDLLF